MQCPLRFSGPITPIINSFLNLNTYMKIQEGSNGQKLITIPRELFKAMGWKKGQELEWSVIDDRSLKLEEK